MVAAGTIVQHVAGWAGWATIVGLLVLVWRDPDVARFARRHRRRVVRATSGRRPHHRPSAGSFTQHGTRGQVRPAGPYLEKRWDVR